MGKHKWLLVIFSFILLLSSCYMRKDIDSDQVSQEDEQEEVQIDEERITTVTALVMWSFIMIWRFLQTTRRLNCISYLKAVRHMIIVQKKNYRASLK